jgi:hypothetical protein
MTKNQNHPMKNKNFQSTAITTLLSAIALALTGCSTPPNANVQPVGKPGLIQGGIPIELVQASVKVTAMDAALHSITLQHSDGSTKAFTLADSVKNLDQVKVGDTINATVKGELSIYILDHGMLPNADGTSRHRTINFNAKVLQVDPGNRLLTLQFDTGQKLAIKAAPDVMLEKMAPGDDVILRANEVTGITIKNP